MTATNTAAAGKLGLLSKVLAIREQQAAAKKRPSADAKRNIEQLKAERDRLLGVLS